MNVLVVTQRNLEEQMKCKLEFDQNIFKNSILEWSYITNIHTSSYGVYNYPVIYCRLSLALISLISLQMKRAYLVIYIRAFC